MLLFCFFLYFFLNSQLIVLHPPQVEFGLHALREVDCFPSNNAGQVAILWWEEELAKEVVSKEGKFFS